MSVFQWVTGFAKIVQDEKDVVVKAKNDRIFG